MASHNRHRDAVAHENGAYRREAGDMSDGAGVDIATWDGSNVRPPTVRLLQCASTLAAGEADVAKILLRL